MSLNMPLSSHNLALSIARWKQLKFTKDNVRSACTVHSCFQPATTTTPEENYDDDHHSNNDNSNDNSNEYSNMDSRWRVTCK